MVHGPQFENHQSRRLGTNWVKLRQRRFKEFQHISQDLSIYIYGRGLIYLGKKRVSGERIFLDDVA